MSAKRQVAKCPSQAKHQECDLGVRPAVCARGGVKCSSLHSPGSLRNSQVTFKIDAMQSVQRVETGRIMLLLFFKQLLPQNSGVCKSERRVWGKERTVDHSAF